jgi:3-oxoacyl-[acyl-carrier-protein] synthase II
MVSAEPASRRVVITGVGIVSPLGIDKNVFWSALVEGRSGVAPLEQPLEDLHVSYGGAAREFDEGIDNFGTLPSDKKKQIRKGLKTLCRESIMGLASAQRAMGDAGYSDGGYEPDRVGVVFGTDYMLMDAEEFASGIAACTTDHKFDFTQWSTTGFAKLFPLWLLRYLPNMPSAHLGIYNDLRGPSNSITFREAAFNLSLTEATRIIQRGQADVMIAGATGTRLHPMALIHVVQNETIANGDAPDRSARPFDLNRRGLVMGEGAGSVVIESLETAQARGATIYGEIVGTGSSAVCDRKLNAKCDVAMANALRAALRTAGMTPDQLGHIQAHGLGTKQSDIDEARAIQAVCGERSSPVPVTALKSYTGQMGAGSGAVELIAGVMALMNNQLFPTLNYETPDPECPLNVVRGKPTTPGDSFANLCVTPQGQASCVIVRRWS